MKDLKLYFMYKLNINRDLKPYIIISVDTFIEESTNTIHLIEDWESLDHQAKYLKWRVETGLLTALDPILDGGAASIKVILCGQKELNI